jgi:hypothetical protein
VQLAPDVAILALRLLLVALVYLFLLFVVIQARQAVSAPRVAVAPVGAAPRRLTVIEGPPGGPDPGVSLALHPRTTIGRAADNVLVVSDPAVSGHHARVVLRDDAWWVEDLGSTNGTYLNEHAVTAPLRAVAGDELQVGPARLRLEP